MKLALPDAATRLAPRLSPFVERSATGIRAVEDDGEPHADEWLQQEDALVDPFYT